jgi:hypothetical protein
LSGKCLIIPINRKKTPWLIAFLNSIITYQDISTPIEFDIVFASTDINEYKYFSKLLNSLQIPLKIRTNCNIGIISIENYIKENLSFIKLLYRFKCNEDNSIINIKKFVALHWAMSSNYEWAVCIDCDTAAISNINNMLEILINNYETNSYFFSCGNSRTSIDNIFAGCSNLFSLEDKRKIDNFTNRGLLGNWFFDAPTYKISDMRDFFEYMSINHGSLENWFTRLKWGTFDHIVYTYWRCLYKKCSIIDYNTTLGIPYIPEELGYNELISIYGKYSYAPVWMSAWEFSLNPDIINSIPNIRLVFHCDRFH